MGETSTPSPFSSLLNSFQPAHRASREKKSLSTYNHGIFITLIWGIYRELSELRRVKYRYVTKWQQPVVRGQKVSEVLFCVFDASRLVQQSDCSLKIRCRRKVINKHSD